MNFESKYITDLTPSYRTLCRLASENLHEARDGYSMAEAEVRVICELEGWSHKNFTGILSVTSPRCSVRRNIRIALEYVGNGIVLQNVFKTVRRSIEICDQDNIINGPKTSAFYAALMGDKNAVVLDTHMADLFGVEQKYAFRRKPEIAFWTQVVRRIARRLGCEPRAAQAALWYAQRYRIGEYPEAFPIVNEYKNWMRYNRSFPKHGDVDTFEEALFGPKELERQDDP
jgi:hypothetical protein